MKSFTPYLALIGIILILLGVVGDAVAGFPFWRVLQALGVICLILYAVYEHRRVRSFLGSRQARYGAGSVLGVVLVLGILVFIGVLTARHKTTWDLTEAKRYGLAPQTRKVLDALEKDVYVTGFFQGGEQGRGRTAKYLLGEYAKVSPLFHYEIVDFDRDPARVKEAGVTDYDTLVVTAGEVSEQVRQLSEEKLTNAVIRVVRPGRKVLYFVTGHGERDLDDLKPNGYSSVKTKLENLNYEVRPLLLMQTEKIPEDASVVVMAGPDADPLPQELDALEQHVRSGGKALFLIDPMPSPGLDAFMDKLNVRLGDDIVIDGTSRLSGFEPYLPLTSNYTIHSALEGFRLPTLYPLARSVSVTDAKTPGVRVVSLIRTMNKESWAETDVEGFKKDHRVALDPEKDTPGPVSLAVAGFIPLEDPGRTAVPADQDKTPPGGRFIVIGDSDFAANGNLTILGNGDLCVSLLSWLAEESDLVAVSAKEQKNQPLMLTAVEQRLVLWVCLVLMPLLVLFAGGFVLILRRKRG